MDGEQTSRDLGLDKVLLPKSEERQRSPWTTTTYHHRPTCAFPDDGVELGTEQSLGVVEDELHHHRLDANLHERRRAAEAGRLNLSGPGTQSENITTYLAAPGAPRK